MKWTCVLLCLCAQALWAQSDSITYQPDLNGRRSVADRRGSSGQGQTTERLQNLNGREVPLERTEERVIREDSRGRVVERITQKFDPNGDRTSTERHVIEETNRPNGSTVRETVYRSDVNGRMREDERRTTESRTQGSRTTVNVTLDRPSLNGGFATVEKRNSTITTTPQQTVTDEHVLRPSGTGGFREEYREVTTEVQNDSQTTSNTAIYEPDVNRRLQLSRQRVETVTQRDDGSQVTETSLYQAAIPGRVYNSRDSQQLYQQEIVDQRIQPDGSVVETTSVRRPTLADPKQLGPAKEIYETICRGNCLPDKAEEEEAAEDNPDDAAADSTQPPADAGAGNP